MAFSLSGTTITQTGTDTTMAGGESLAGVSATDAAFITISNVLSVEGNLTADKNLAVNRLQIKSTGANFLRLGSNTGTGEFKKFISLYIDKTPNNQWSNTAAGLGVEGNFIFENVHIRFGTNVAPSGQTGILGGWQYTGAGNGNNRIFRRVFFEMDNAGNGGHAFLPECVLDEVYFNGIDFIFFEYNPIFATGIEISNSNWGLVFSDKTEIELQKGKTTRITNQGNSGSIEGFWKLVDFVITDCIMWRQNSNSNAGYRFFKTFSPHLEGDSKAGIKIKLFNRNNEEIIDFATNSSGTAIAKAVKWIEFTRGSYGKSNCSAFSPAAAGGTIFVDDFNADIANENIAGKSVLYQLPITIVGISYLTKIFTQIVSSLDITEDSYRDNYQIVAIPEADNAVTELDEAIAAAYTGIQIDYDTEVITLTENISLENLYDYAKFEKVNDQILRPTISSQAVIADGTALMTDFEIIINAGVAISGSKFTKIITTSTITNNGTAAVALQDVTGVFLSLTITNIKIGYEVVIGEKTNNNDGRELYDIELLHIENASETEAVYNFVTNEASRSFIVQIIPSLNDAGTVKPFIKKIIITDKSDAVDAVYQEYPV